MTTAETAAPPVTDGAATTPAQPRLREALIKRMDRKVRIRGEAIFPCLPALLDEITERLDRVFETLGKPFTGAEVTQLRALLDSQLRKGFAQSALSQLKVTWWSDAAKDQLLHYHINIVERSKTGQYEEWVKNRKPPLFGAYPDARAMDLARQLPKDTRIADLGAGTGRNTIPLAEAGYRVDAIDATASFLETIAQEAETRGVDELVTTTEAEIESDLKIMPRGAYGLVLLSQVVPDLRELSQLRHIFALADELLAPGGYLLFNAFVAEGGYRPDALARELSQCHWSWFVTRGELEEARQGTGLRLQDDEEAEAYERARLPDWPPTGWYSHWAQGNDLFGLGSKERPPIVLRWLNYRKAD